MSRWKYLLSAAGLIGGLLATSGCLVAQTVLSPATATPSPTQTPTQTSTPRPNLSSVRITLDDIPASFADLPASALGPIGKGFKPQPGVTAENPYGFFQTTPMGLSSVSTCCCQLSPTRPFLITASA